ncbi:MAG: hypothetical protein ACRDUV_08515, partial [Pseudonocardiaceae bacterium]
MNLRRNSTAEHSGDVPEVFAAAEVPPPDLQEKDAATAEVKSGDRSGLKSDGVPATRLAGWSLLVLLLVAVLAMWAVSPLLAVVVLGGIALLAVAGFVALLGWRRRSRRSRAEGSRSWLKDRSPAGRPRGKSGS